MMKQNLRCNLNVGSIVFQDSLMIQVSRGGKFESCVTKEANIRFRGNWQMWLIIVLSNETKSCSENVQNGFIQVRGKARHVLL